MSEQQRAEQEQKARDKANAQADLPDKTPPAEPQTYDPSEQEATRGRMQGLGVGEQDIQRQRDPTRGTPERRDQSS